MSSFSIRIAPELLTVEENDDSNWNVESGYKMNASANEVYPFRVFGSGSSDMFFAILSLTLDDYEGHQFCSDFSQVKTWMINSDFSYLIFPLFPLSFSLFSLSSKGISPFTPHTKWVTPIARWIHHCSTWTRNLHFNQTANNHNIKRLTSLRTSVQRLFF